MPSPRRIALNAGCAHNWFGGQHATVQVAIAAYEEAAARVYQQVADVADLSGSPKLPLILSEIAKAQEESIAVGSPMPAKSRIALRAGCNASWFSDRGFAQRQAVSAYEGALKEIAAAGGKPAIARFNARKNSA
jgi:hypothetical protein